jgi:hypothetical protein
MYLQPFEQYKHDVVLILVPLLSYTSREKRNKKKLINFSVIDEKQKDL